MLLLIYGLPFFLFWHFLTLINISVLLICLGFFSWIIFLLFLSKYRQYTGYWFIQDIIVKKDVTLRPESHLHDHSKASFMHQTCMFRLMNLHQWWFRPKQEWRHLEYITKWIHWRDGSRMLTLYAGNWLSFVYHVLSQAMQPPRGVWQ